MDKVEKFFREVITEEDISEMVYFEKRKEYRNYDEFIKHIENSLWENIHENYPEYEDVIGDILARAERVVKEELKKKAIETLEEMIEEAKAKKVGLAIGVQHTVPHRYYLEYLVLYDDSPEEDIKTALEESGIKPHAWGVILPTHNWANYWFEEFDEKDIEEIKKGEKELDEDIAVVIFTQPPERELRYSKQRSGKPRP